MKTLTLSLVLAASAACGPPDSLTPAQLNYDDAGNWLCLPGKTGDVCQTDLSATVAESNLHVDAVNLAVGDLIDRVR